MTTLALILAAVLAAAVLMSLFRTLRRRGGGKRMRVRVRRRHSRQMTVPYYF